MGFFGDFVGGAADAGAGIIANQIRTDQATEAANQRAKVESDLATAREQTIAQTRLDLQNRAANQFAQSVSSHMGDDVTVPPTPATEVNGPLAGNVAKLRQQLTSDPSISPDDRKAALAQLDQQVQTETASQPQQTRKATMQEAQQSALGDMLKQGNGAAYVAGKGMIPDKTMVVPDGGALLDQQTGKVLFQNTGKADRQVAHEDFLNDRQKLEIESQMTKLRMQLDPLGINGGGQQTPASQAIAEGKTGQDLLDTLSPTVATMVKKLAAGEMAFPNGAGLKSPTWQTMIGLVGQYDPSFDGVDFNARSRTRQAFTSGKEAQSVNALNTVIGHLDDLGVAADRLNNTSIPMWNTVANAVESGMGDPRIKQFEAAKKTVVDELTRVWRGTGGSEGDIKSWSSVLDSASSPAQLHGVVEEIGSKLGSKIDALNEQYSKGMGRTADGMNLLTPKSQKALQSFRQRAGMDTSSGQVGNTLTYDPRTGRFN